MTAKRVDESGARIPSADETPRFRPHPGRRAQVALLDAHHITETEKTKQLKRKDEDITEQEDDKNHWAYFP
ncbi:hypothetical protein SRHO_G00255430 [Serrasalmus rhombeus]